MEGNYIFEKSAGEKAFWLCNGKKVDTIKELHKWLGTMDDSVFGHHVNSERNDFSAWLMAVFHESELANSISKLTDKKEIKSLIGKWISDVVREKYKSKKMEKLKAIKHVKKILTKVKAAVVDNKPRVSKKKRVKSSHVVSKPYVRNDLIGLDRPVHIMGGIFDFVLGFVLGALAMILFNKLI